MCLAYEPQPRFTKPCLGWAGRELGLKSATPIFDGASLEQINEYTAQAGVPRSGRTYLFDGGTGERFDQPATVGVIYVLKSGPHGR